MIEGDWPMIQMEILERLVRFWFLAGLFAGIFVVLVGMRITRRIIKKRAERQAKAKKSWEEVVEKAAKELHESEGIPASQVDAHGDIRFPKIPSISEEEWDAFLQSKQEESAVWMWRHEFPELK